MTSLFALRQSLALQLFWRYLSLGNYCRRHFSSGNSSDNFSTLEFLTK